MDWKERRCEAILQQIKDAVRPPDTEYKIQLLMQEDLPEEANYATHLYASEADGTEDDPFLVEVHVLQTDGKPTEQLPKPTIFPWVARKRHARWRKEDGIKLKRII